MSTQTIPHLITLVKTQENAEQVLKQTCGNPFPLKGIEHTYVKHNHFDFCKYCGYREDNLMHS